MPKDFERYCTSQRIHTASQTLKGIIMGITADGVLHQAERAALLDWIDFDPQMQLHHPFNELVPRIKELLEGGSKPDQETIADLLWMCDRLDDGITFYAEDTTDLQKLHGILGGIIADNRIDIKELLALQSWIDDHRYLSRCWPFDEVESLVGSTLADGKIDQDEHANLLAFFADFQGCMLIRNGAAPMTVQGVCALQPAIDFEGKYFCFTGESHRATRNEMHRAVSLLGGKLASSVRLDLDYLVIGASGNQCWTYAAYGRKIETAMKMRRDGGRVLIVHENDFWDAIQDAAG